MSPQTVRSVDTHAKTVQPPAFPSTECVSHASDHATPGQVSVVGAAGIATALHQDIEHDALLIDGAPEIMLLVLDPSKPPATVALLG
jgi:hypothetical protein